MYGALKWMSVVGLGLDLMGFTGLSIAMHVYPNSNMLGGWALIFAPIFWLGLLICITVALAWIVVGLIWLCRGRRRTLQD